MEELFVKVVQQMCRNINRKVRVGETYSDAFCVKERSVRAMLRYIYGIRFEEKIAISSLYKCLNIRYLETSLRYNRLCTSEARCGLASVVHSSLKVEKVKTDPGKPRIIPSLRTSVPVTSP